MNNKKMKCPDYFKEFKCIGGECEDTCCTGWQIDVDEDTFNQYKELEDKDLKNKFMDSICINEECVSNEVDYAKIMLNNSNRCPFLNDDNYCNVHSEMGEGCLSNTCSHYPRTLNKIDDDYEISLDISCPEAARLILSKMDGITFTEEEISLKKYIVASEFDTNDEEFEELPIKDFREIRDYCIKIIQDREYSISKRLYILGDFLVNLEKVTDDDCTLACRFMEEYDIAEAADSYVKNNDNYIMQISFFKNIIESLDVYNEIESPIFKQYTKEVMDGFNVKDKFEIEEDSDRLIDGFAAYTEKYIEENSYIFENYLVNIMYGSLFPYSESDSMFEGYIMLLIRYSLMRFYLVGKYLFNKNDSEKDIIKFIQVYTKAMEHDKDYMCDVFDYVIENEFDNMEFAEMLI